MPHPIRPGFETERLLALSDDDDDGIVLDATPAERIEMVWELTKSCWAFMPEGVGHAEREFQRHIECVRRGKR